MTRRGNPQPPSRRPSTSGRTHRTPLQTLPASRYDTAVDDEQAREVEQVAVGNRAKEQRRAEAAKLLLLRKRRPGGRVPSR
jgi:hypothetical protein